jgi:hypothetical protein
VRYRVGGTITSRARHPGNKVTVHDLRGGKSVLKLKHIRIFEGQHVYEIVQVLDVLPGAKR